MIKKIIICFFFAMLFSCGFTPMLKDFDVSTFNIQKINYVGKNKLTYLAKNYLNIQEKKNKTGLIVNLKVSENFFTSKRNASGKIIEEQMNLSINMSIANGQGINLLTDTVSVSRKISITSNVSSDNENRRIAKNSLMQTLTQKVKFKLQLVSKLENDSKKF